MDVKIKTARASQAFPVPVIRALRKLGHDIRDARRRRRIPVAILAERASISRMTLNKIEKGDAGVSHWQLRYRHFCVGADRAFADPRLTLRRIHSAANLKKSGSPNGSGSPALQNRRSLAEPGKR